MKIEKCPKCSSKMLQNTVCEKCGRWESTALLGKLFHLPPSFCFFTDCLERDIPDGKIVAYSYGTIINVIHNDAPFFDIPTMFPRFPDSKDIILLDNVELLEKIEEPTNVFAFTKWSQFWIGEFKNFSSVTLLFSKDIVSVTAIAKQLMGLGVAVKIGRWIDNLKDSLEQVYPVTEDNKFLGLHVATKKNKSLTEIIECFHMVESKRGYVYQRSINIPVRIIVDEVIDWFVQNDGKFIWDVENKQGYLLFEDRLYRLMTNDLELRSLLRTKGGVTHTDGEGKAIIDGLCSCAFIGEHLRLEPWIRGDVVSNNLKIQQRTSTILIQSNSVQELNDRTLSYDLLMGDKSWYNPITFSASVNEKDALNVLNNEIFMFMALPTVAREIVTCWTLGVFLRDFAFTRPGIRLYGPPSAGKSTILQMLFWLIYGKDDIVLPSGSSIAGLWRIASVEPLIPIDNENLSVIDPVFRQFLDVCATGGKRVIGVGGGDAYATQEQRAHSLIIMSGLDTALDHDVRTRYFEIEVESKYRTVFVPLSRRSRILANRSLILNGFFRLIANEVLPNISWILNEEANIEYKILLGCKERTVDYFLLMLLIGKGLQKFGIFKDGDLGLRWTNYICEKAKESDRAGASTIEWWRNFQIALARGYDEAVVLDGYEVKASMFNLLYEDNKIRGITGTQEELLNALAWSASVLKRKLPWDSTRDIARNYGMEKKVWEDIGWSLEINEKEISVKWNL